MTLKIEKTHLQPNGTKVVIASNMPIRYYVPNLITILAVCAGMSAIRLSFEAHYEKAIFMVLVAAALDGFDGRIARLLKASSAFGAQMDSLADAINFGVAPALIVYSYMLHEAGGVGWIAALIYSIACCLRLARFNVMLENSVLSHWQKDYFVGIPAPAGALLALLPMYLGALGMLHGAKTVLFFSLYLVIIAFLLVSKLPVWNAKNIANSLRRDLMVPLLLILVAYVSFVAAYPWQTLTLTTFFYIIFLPLSYLSYIKKARYYKNQDNRP